MFFRRSIHPSQADLSAYVDGELAVAVARTIGHHADGCAECRAHLAELRDTKALLANLPRAALPRSFILSGAQVGEQRALASRPSPLRFAPAMALSLFVALVLFDVASLPSSSNDASSGAPAGGLPAKSSAESADTAAQRSETTTAAGNAPALAPAPPVGGAGGATLDAGAPPPQPSGPAAANQAAPAVEGFALPTPAPAEASARSALTAPTPALAPVPAAVPTVVAPNAEPAQDAVRRNSARDDDSGVGVLRVLQIIAAAGFVISLIVLAWPKLTRKEPR